MDPHLKIPLEDLNQIQMRDLVDQMAEEYRDVLKIRLKNKGLAGVVEEIGVRQRSSAGFFDVDTGAIAVVEHRTGGKTTRQVIKLNNGFRSEKSAPIARNFGEPHRLVQQGPFRGSIKGQKVTYIKHGDVRIEYKGHQVTRIVGPDEIEIPRAKFGDVKIFPNEHHAEMRILQWAERNNYRIVALAPTRGCCPHCALAMQQYFIKQNVNIDDAIPKVRQNRSLWRSFLKELKAPPKSAPVEYTVKGGKLDVAALRAKFKTQVTAFKSPDPRLVRISKVLKVAGPAMLVFDAATSYAKAADQWDKGERDAAAETLAEFGGRAAGAFVGAEACGLALAGCGSVIPGLGTTVGGLAGIVIGGVVGAYLGEQGARQLCDQIIAWTKGEQPSAPPPWPQVASKPHSTNPEVAKLQSEMQAAGYSAPEIAGIGRLFESPALQGKTPAEAFQQIGNGLVPQGATNEGDTWLAQFPEPGEPDQKVTSVQPMPTQPIGWPIPTPTAGPRPQVQPPPGLTRAPRYDRSQPPQVVETVHAELLKPQGNAPAPIEATDAPLSPTPPQVEVVSTAEISERVDQLRSRLQEYDALAAGQAGPVSRDQFEADSNELRNIQDQLVLSGASPMELHALQTKLNEVRNRYEQVESDAHWADVRKADILQKQQNEERWRADQAARDSRRADETADAANVQQQKDRALRDIEEDERKDRERERREDQERADLREQQEQEAKARHRQADDDREARWKAEDDLKREADRQRDDEYRKTQEIRSQQDAEARDKAAKLAEEERTRDAERRQQDAAYAQQLAEDNRNREAELRRDDDARKADEIRSQQDADAQAQAEKLADEQQTRDADRRQQDAVHTQQLADDNIRWANEAARREEQRMQDDKEAQRRIDAAHDQALAEEQRRVDDQRRQDAIRAQEEADEKRLAAKEDERRADELRQQELNRQIADQARRDTVNPPPAESPARADADNQRNYDDQRAVDMARKAEDARYRTEKERQLEEQRLADQAAQAEHARQLDDQAHKARQTPANNAQSRESTSPRAEDRQPVETRDTAGGQGYVDLQVEARIVNEALRKQELDQQQQEEQQRRLEEARYQQQLEQQRRAEEDARRQQEEERQRREDEWRRQQEEQQRRQQEEDWRRQQEAEEQRQLEAAWRQEQERQAEEEWRRRQQQEEEQRQMQEIWRQQQEEQQRRAEEEARRQQEEEQRRREDEWRRQQEEQQRRQQEEDWRRQQQEEADRRQRQEEEDRKSVSAKILWPGQDPYP